MSEYEDFTPNTTGNTNCGFPTPAHLLYMGDVPWQHIPPPPPWYGQVQVPVMLTTGTSTEQQDLRTFIAAEIARQLPDAIRSVLEDDAHELATNPAFQAVYVPATGVCWACGKPGQDNLRWYTRGGHSHLVHDSEECRMLAAEKPEMAEHRG